MSTHGSTVSGGIQGTVDIEIANSGPLGFLERRARIGGVDDEFFYGVSPAWRSHYGVSEGDFEPHATTNDVFVASAASCLLAVFAGALGGRNITVTQDMLTARAYYDIGPVGEGNEWIIRSMRVVFSLHLDDEKDRATAERVLGFYEAGCPLSKILKAGRCKVTSELVFV